MDELIPFENLENEIGIYNYESYLNNIKNSGHKYRPKHKIFAEKIITSYENCDEQDKHIITEETINYLKKFLKDYDEETAQFNETVDQEQTKHMKLKTGNYKELKKAELYQEKINQLIMRRDQEARAELTELIVEKIKEEHIIITTRQDERNSCWIYQDGIYLPQGKTYIQETVRKTLQKNYTPQLCNLVTEKIEADTYIDEQEFFNKQNEHPEIIPVQNGILNIKTKELKPYNPKIPFFNKLPMKYNPKEDCPNIKKFLKEILPDQKDILQTIQELFGFALLKEYKYERSVMFLGKGRNGKSKLLYLLETFLGIDNISNVSLQDLEKQPFSIVGLQNKLINISADISNEGLQNTGNFKALTGRDEIEAPRKFKDSIKFRNYAKMMFACNEMPSVKEITKGFWLRWIVIKFPYQFLPQKEINILSDEEKKITKLQNPDIMQNITTEKELEGLLNWALEGFARLEKLKDFSYKATSAEVQREWKLSSNSVLAFIEDHIIEDYDSKVSKNEFRNAYSHYCKEHKVRPLGDKSIKISLENELGVSDAQMTNSYGNLERVWVGVKFSQGSQDSQGFSTYRQKKNSIDKFEKGVKPVNPVKENTDQDVVENISLPNEEKNFGEDLQTLPNIAKEPKQDTNELIIKQVKAHNQDNSGKGMQIQKFIDIFGEETYKKLRRQGDIFEIQSGYLKA